jgi:predicted dehydrogenase
MADASPERGDVKMINAAVVGLGRWGKSIVQAVQGRSGRIRVVHGVSKEPETVRDFAARQGFRLSTAFEDAIADPLVEAVFLATPHSLHVGQVVAAAEAGKHVWCEKPLALTRQEARRAVEACRRAGVVLATGFNKRCFASMRELKRLVDSGALGDILHVEGHYCNEHSTRVSGGWRDDPSESPGAGMTGAGLHVLDAFVNLAGPVARVDARLYSHKPAPDPRDALAISLQFATGATGLMGTVRAGPFYWRVHAFGTKGWAEASGEDRLTVAPMGEAPQVREFPHVDSLHELIEAFAQAVSGSARFPISPEQMLETIGAFEAVVDSAGSGRPTELAWEANAGHRELG